VPLILTNTTGAGENFTWSLGDGSTSPGAVVTHSYKQAGNYIITLNGIDSRGCTILIEKNIEVQNLFITNALSPNGDGKNDKLYIQPFNYTAAFTIVNRWGQVVYESSPYHNDFTGGGMEAGVYYYQLYFKEIDKSFRGTIEIKR
jgi:gliding motility-associated-like protein